VIEILSVITRESRYISNMILSTNPLIRRWVSIGPLILIALAAPVVSGCLSRPGDPTLPYVKPANTAPNVDPGRVRIFSRLEEMETELQRLRGMIERLQVTGGDRNAIRNLQERVGFLERHLGIEPPATETGAPQATPQVRDDASPPSIQPPDVPPDASTVPPSAQPEGRVEVRNAPIPDDERAYRDAYLMIRRGAPDKAVPLLEKFLKDYPKSRFTADAVYWIGEALYDQGRYDEAVLQFDRVLKEYRGSKKELTALLKQGQAFAKMGDTQSARIIFEKLIKEHPHAAQARIAKSRLKALPAR